MGCDIHSFVERRTDGTDWTIVDTVEPFETRDYGIFGFLADVRNYSHSPVIAEPRGLPDDCAEGVRKASEHWGGDGHSHSWLSVAELLSYDYEQVFWDRRVTKDGNGAALADEGEGEHLPLRDFLGRWYFAELARLEAIGPPEDVRIVFWFDN